MATGGRRARALADNEVTRLEPLVGHAVGVLLRSLQELLSFRAGALLEGFVGVDVEGVGGERRVGAVVDDALLLDGDLKPLRLALSVQEVAVVHALQGLQ